MKSKDEQIKYLQGILDAQVAYGNECEGRIEDLQAENKKSIEVERLVTAATKYADTHKVLNDRIQKDTEAGRLIMRYGDLPEWEPYEEAKEELLDRALEFASKEKDEVVGLAPNDNAKH